MEAAVVLPVLMMAVITAVLIIMFFYSQMTEQSRMHVALRQEAGKITEQTVYLHESGYDGELTYRKTLQGGTVQGSKKLLMEHRGILLRNGSFMITGRAYAPDGPDYVRFCNFMKGMQQNETTNP